MSMKEISQFLQKEGFYDMTYQEKDKILSRVWVDFNNADSEGRFRLHCTGTVQDLNACGIPLKEGVKIMMYQEEIEIPGEIVFSEEERIWVAKVDWLKRIENMGI